MSSYFTRSIISTGPNQSQRNFQILKSDVKLTSLPRTLLHFAHHIPFRETTSLLEFYIHHLTILFDMPSRSLLPIFLFWVIDRPTLDELDRSLYDYAYSVGFSIKRCSTHKDKVSGQYDFVTWKCSAGGISNSTSKGVRASKSMKRGCNFKVITSSMLFTRSWYH